MRKRRALTESELKALVAAAGPRTAVYLVAVYTGLRRAELQSLEWQDVRNLEGNAFLSVRASTTKNHKQASIPLHENLANALLSLRPPNWKPCAKVFEHLIPRMPRFRADLETAGIAYTDTKGAIADFHSLRMTFATLLTLNGVTQREIMELMRHSDMRLTAKVYTDAGLLPLGTAMHRLPSLVDDSQIDSHILVPERLPLSRAVPERRNALVKQAAEIQEVTDDLASFVPPCPKAQMVRDAGFEPAAPAV